MRAPGLVVLLIIHAAVVLGGVALLLVEFGRQAERELDREVTRVERQIDRDFDAVERAIERELDERLPVAP